MQVKKNVSGLVKLGDLVNPVKGKKPKRISKFNSPEFSVPYINIKAFEKGIIDEYTDGEGCVLCDEEDFLMVWDGSRSGYVGKGMKGALGSTLVKLSFPEIDNDYAYYFLQSKYLDLNTRAKGVGIPHVDPNILWNYEITIPSREVQKRIVLKIEELFSELDKGIEYLRLVQQQLKTYRQAVLKWAFEGRLTNENVKDGELPEGWTQVQLKDVADTFGGYAFKSGEFKKHGKYQVLRMGNVRPGILRLEENPVFLDKVDDIVLIRSLLQINDVIITQTGTRKKRDYGFTTLIEKENLLLNQRIASIRFKDNYLPKFFLYFSWTSLFKDQFFANETGNVGQGNVGIKGITDTFLPICSKEIQKTIIDEIELRFSEVDKLEQQIELSISKAEYLRHSILKTAFTGK